MQIKISTSNKSVYIIGSYMQWNLKKILLISLSYAVRYYSTGALHACVDVSA